MGKPQPVFKVDRAKSKRRAKKLQSYLAKHVWDPSTRKAWPDFICECKRDCKASARKSRASFHEAQGHAVGDCYELATAGGVPLRVLVVPMEAGGGDRYFSVERRTEQVRRSGRLPWHQSDPKEGFRNAHMKGVTLALRLALGLSYVDTHGRPLIERPTERVRFSDGTDAHLFDCFAMANLLLCSAVPKPGSQKSLANAVMRANCAKHLAQTINILQPTLVISQGWTLVDTLLDSLGVTHEVDLGLDGCRLAYCDLDGDQFVWVALKHPTRLWNSATQPYFVDTVESAVKQARRRALILGRKRQADAVDGRQ